MSATETLVLAPGGGGPSGVAQPVNAPAARITRSNPSEANCRDFPLVMATPRLPPYLRYLPLTSDKARHLAKLSVFFGTQRSRAGLPPYTDGSEGRSLPAARSFK